MKIERYRDGRRQTDRVVFHFAFRDVKINLSGSAVYVTLIVSILVVALVGYGLVSSL